MDWRRPGGWGQQSWGGGGGRQSRNWKPPQPPGPTYPSVPAWEKRFCSSRSIPWKKLCETKNVMSMYKSVVEWDDSAALEAFQAAKSRFWADFNGIHCSLPLPDPDLYIDKVDYYPAIDAELVADLEKKQALPAKRANDTNNGWDSVIIFGNNPVQATGWGDAEDPVPSNNNTAERRSGNWDIYIKEPIVPTGWGDADCPVPQNNTETEPYASGWDKMQECDNGWNSGSGNNHCDYGNAWNFSASYGYGTVQNNSWGGGQHNTWDSGRNNSWDTWENKNNYPHKRNSSKRDRGHFGMRSTRSRYQEDNYQTSNRWRDNRGSNRMDYPYEKAVHDKQPLSIR